MVRKLKHHEEKLLKKVDFINWEVDNNLHEVKIIKKYHIQKREDYTLYNKLSREVRGMVDRIKQLDSTSNDRTELSAMVLDKMYVMGLIPTKWSLENCAKINASTFCRRRLPVVMVRNKMAQSISMATQFIEQGHVRVGPNMIQDPAYLVTRPLEDFVTWMETSSIREKVMEYNDVRDDYDGKC